MKRILSVLLVVVVYCGAYLGYRYTHLETWDRDGRTYLIFGSSTAYYIFRPASYTDALVTGVGIHIGPHR